MNRPSEHESLSAPNGPSPAGALDPRSILSSVGDAIYSWDLETDRITWSQNASQVLGLDVGQAASGSAYAVLTDAASPTSLQLTILDCKREDRGTGVAYAARYLINSAPGRKIWVEDKGRWFADGHGRPRLAHGVVRVVQAASEGEARLALDKQIDPATGALTRAEFANALGESLQRMRYLKRQLVLLLFGVDDLATLNRTYGYNVGDEVIAGVTRRIRGNVRKFDVIGRYSGNKIIALLAPSLADEIERTAMRVAAAVRETPVATSAGAISASVRVGGVVAPRDAQDMAEALHAAEEALADAKAEPNVICAIYSKDAGVIRRRQDNAAQTDEVLSALNDRRVQLAFQPLRDARTGRIAMYESLVRMRSPAGDIVSAGAIVPVAEKLGFVHMVDHRVMELAIQKLKERPDVRLTFNAGVVTVLHPEWLTSFRSLVGAAPDVASRLIVEITETALIADMEAARRVIETVKSFGVKVAIDDFGAGHTSFRNMRELPVDILKIDGAFIKNLTQSSDDRFFVRTLLQLANHLGIETVAEWVQDEESARLLTEWGVAYLQGDFVGSAADTLPEPEIRAVA